MLDALDHVPVTGRTFYEVASEVLDKLVAQGGTSIGATDGGSGSGFVYFGDDGRRCGIGWTMPGLPRFNDQPLLDLLRHGSGLPSYWVSWMKSNIDKACLLQELHDNPVAAMTKIDRWPAKLKVKANRWMHQVQRPL